MKNPPEGIRLFAGTLLVQYLHIYGGIEFAKRLLQSFQNVNETCLKLLSYEECGAAFSAFKASHCFFSILAVHHPKTDCCCLLQTDREIDRQIDRQTDRQIDR